MARPRCCAAIDLAVARRRDRRGAGRATAPASRRSTAPSPACCARVARRHPLRRRGHRARARRPTIVARGLIHVPEGRRIFPNLTVRENLDLGSYRRGPRAPRANRERVFAIFPRLRERLRQRAGTLSGGEQQMLAIGRGLMAEPRLLILDEPSLGLSPLLVEELFALIGRINARGPRRPAGRAERGAEPRGRAPRLYPRATARFVLSGQRRRDRRRSASSNAPILGCDGHDHALRTS